MENNRNEIGLGADNDSQRGFLSKGEEIIAKNLSQNYDVLKGLIVVELEGYLPISFMGKMLKDLGAEIILVKQTPEKDDIPILSYISHLEDDKRPIYLNLKQEKDSEIFKAILSKSDVLLEGYRPGVLEKINLDPIHLIATYNRLIVLRMTGYGQDGIMSKEPGHEINYLSLSGIFDLFKTEENKIIHPDLIIGDLFCGSLMPLYHLSQALLNRTINNHGCIIDTAITTNLMSMSMISNKFVDKENFYFSSVTKNYEYLLFTYKNNEKLNYYLKLTCERLIIETINLSTISEGTRLRITRDYIDFFELITKSVSESIKYIKELCRKLTKKEILKSLQKSKCVEVYPVIQNKDIYKFYEETHLLKKENIRSPFKISENNHVGKKNLAKKIISEKNISKDTFSMLKDMGLKSEEIEYIEKSNLKTKPKF